MENFAQFCQKCRAANEVNDINCQKCGTRLMIVTFPTSKRHEPEMIPPSYYEDHLLERVTLLELRLKQVTEQLAMTLEFFARQTVLFEKDHLFVASFMDAVMNVEPNLSERLAQEMSEVYSKKKQELFNENKKQKVLTEIFANHKNKNVELFTHLVNEGINLLEKNEEKQAFRTLERAALLSPENISLQLFIAEKLYSADKFDAAKEYLQKLYENSPNNPNVLLLLGIIYADEYQAEKSRKMLSVLAGIPKKMFVANCIWGMLSASEGNYKEAIVAFKESLEVFEIAEVNYLIGCAYFQTQNFPLALEFLEKTVVEEAKFADAWFMLSSIYEIFNDQTKAENARESALKAQEAGAKCLKFLSKKSSIKLDSALPFLHFHDDKKRLLSGGSLRMTKFFKRMVFKMLD